MNKSYLRRMTEINKKNLTSYIIKYNAQASITTSALRSQVAPGGINCCREFCGNIDIEEFKEAINGDYNSYLEVKTNEFVKYVSKFDLRWGSARKILNIFFRRLCMDAILMGKRPSDLVFNKLEIPVDSKVAHGLLVSNGLSKYRWKTIKNLSPEKHQEYQIMSINLAKKRGVPPVFLDFEFWTK